MSDIKFVEPNPNVWVVLDRTDDNPSPDYCTHSKTRCMLCTRWCWLSAGTFELVATGEASPFCRQCAAGRTATATYLGSVDAEEHQR